MDYRTNIVNAAKDWADPGEWKPDADTLVSFFKYSGAEFWPTRDDAQKALDRGGVGVKVNGQIKHWCGIFACYVIRTQGVLKNVQWTLNGGKIRGLPLIWGNKGMKPGDVAIIKSGEHHFIVTDIDYSKNSLCTVEGNTDGQYIRAKTNRTTAEPYAYYRIPE